MKRHLGQKNEHGLGKSSRIGLPAACRDQWADANAKVACLLRNPLPPTLYIFSGIRYIIKTMPPLRYRPIIATSLRADANRRIRSISRRYLSTFPHLDGNSGTGSCEPAIKLRSILERYRQDKYVLSRMFSPHCCSNKSLMKWFRKTSISCALLGARFHKNDAHVHFTFLLLSLLTVSQVNHQASLRKS